jgi:acetyl esterase
MPIKVKDHLLQTDFGQLKIREYCPENNAISSPILYFHGGGYVLGGIESHDDALQFFSAEMGANIFSLDYRLAPENKFPSSLQDANLALEWLGKELNIPISEISLCGDSAGGHLCASLSTYRAINKLELPVSQCLIYPMTDPLCNSKSQVDFDSGFFLSQKAMIWFWQQLMDSSDNLNNPAFNLTIDPQAQLPKTLIITAGFDPLSDEGEAYARLLDNMGNEVQQIHYPHLIHGFVNMTALKAAKDATKDLLKTYKNFLK